LTQHIHITAVCPQSPTLCLAVSTSHNMKLQVAETVQLHLDQSISMVEPATADILNKLCP